jgi:hypothetical protein
MFEALDALADEAVTQARVAVEAAIADDTTGVNGKLSRQRQRSRPTPPSGPEAQHEPSRAQSTPSKGVRSTLSQCRPPLLDTSVPVGPTAMTTSG